MVLLEKLWDDVVAGPQPDRGLGMLRKITTSQPSNIKDDGEGSKYQRSTSMPATPTTPTTPTTPLSGRKVDNVWRSVFNPGSNSATRSIGAEMFDKPLPNSPTVYDWYYYISYYYCFLIFLLVFQVQSRSLIERLHEYIKTLLGLLKDKFLRLYSGDSRSKHR